MAAARPGSGPAMIAALRELGLLASDERASATALSGGVSSDVFRVCAGDGRAWVVKRSIPRLRVAADWRAPVDRDRGEVAWLKAVRLIDPRLVPEVLAWSPEAHLFVMPWLDPADYPVWKLQMASGQVDPAFAAAVGSDLAQIHGHFAARVHLEAQFAFSEAFMALRIEPFFLFVAHRHPDVADRLRALAKDLERRRTTLIQGDISPKNILAGPGGPVFLDAECATWGDPAFDLAFCLTHLLLKTVWLSPLSDVLMTSFCRLIDAYQGQVSWEDSARVSGRAAAYIGALLLARVDGKSPAGYLDRRQKGIVRERAKALLSRSDLSLQSLAQLWRKF